jgi:Protein of unknown function (DUF2971)
VALPADLQADIEAFSAEAGRLSEALCNDLNARSRPLLVYHYTNDEGLHGILKSGAFRTTDIFYLNDPSELRHGIAPALEAVRNAARTGGVGYERFAKRFEEKVNGRLERIARFFVSCFSGARDDLGQWRAYGDNGHGYALGFNTAALEKCFTDRSREGKGCNTFPVAYSEERLVALQRSIVALAVPLFGLASRRELSDEVMNEYVERACTALAVDVVTVAVFFKHRAYEHEDELRFIEIHSKKLAQKSEFRTRPYTLVPFQTFDWKETAGTALQEIVIGPAADEARARRFAEDCLRAFHPGTAGSVRITKSEIPYSSERPR